MKQSQLFSKTLKVAPKDEPSQNAQLLIRGGYVDKLMAGVYSLLPLGWRVMKNIEAIIREEMNAIGGQELYLPSMHPKVNWQQTGRWDSLDVLYRLAEDDVAFGPTHEEVIAPLAKKFVQSYRDLPLAVYQIQNKFRRERRAKSGLLRGREFIMKDLYSFHADEADLDAYYERVRGAYERIFARLGLGRQTHYTYAAGGSFSKYSHEFQTVTAAGEDTIHICAGCGRAINEEIKAEMAVCPGCGGTDFTAAAAVEVGNIFKLKTKYSDPFKLTYTDATGTEQPVLMGCYGIGLQRLMGTIVEVFADDQGIVWPVAVAPYRVHLIGLNLDDPSVRAQAAKVYQELQQAGLAVLFDDRPEATAGAKFADADLLGMPVRLLVSAKTGGKVEYKLRTGTTAELLDTAAALAAIKALS
ncbi:hypothetical protein HY933_00825 [Candidatus Falkowbacteria bacterium]|nr:hypothetical protein [Candidatus Falkowbacteria bacterium]